MNSLFDFIAEALAVGWEKKWRNAPIWMWMVMAGVIVVSVAGLLAMVR